MAEHETITSFIGSALAEYLVGSKLSLEYQKSGGWHGDDVDGCLGMTSALLLFCVADAIGSYLRRRDSFSVPVDGRSRTIKSDGYCHLFVLNASDLYGCNLSEAEIKALYDEYRSLLAHNAAIAGNRAIVADPSSDDPFPLFGGVRHVNVLAFHQLSCDAAETFLAGYAIEDSQAVQIIKLRGRIPLAAQQA